MRHAASMALALAATTFTVFGDAAETNEVAELGTVVVTASPIAKEERFTPDGADVTVVGAEQTSRLTAQDLPTALRQVLQDAQNYYTTSEIEVTLRYLDGAWRMDTSPALFTALLGGV